MLTITAAERPLLQHQLADIDNLLARGIDGTLSWNHPDSKVRQHSWALNHSVLPLTM